MSQSMSGQQAPVQSPYLSANSQVRANQNALDRATLLATGVQMIQKIGTQSGIAAGATMRQRLSNVGVITRLKVRVTATIDITAAATASPFGPYGLISVWNVQDYNTTDRIKVSGIELYHINSVRHGRPWMPTGQGLVDTEQTQLPTAIGNNQQIIFNVDLPLAYDPGSDLRGAILAQTVVGQQVLNATVNNTLVGDATSPYTAGTVTLTGVQFDMWQEYIMPQNASLPLIDLNTVYELAGTFRVYAGIVTGGQVFFDYPNVRSVIGAYHHFIDNGTGTINGADVSDISMVVNGNTTARDYDPLLLRKDSRLLLGGDIPASLYYIPSRRQPIQTAIYSQVQSKWTFGIVTATPAPYMGYAYESFYGLNTPLPGIAG